MLEEFKTQAEALEFVHEFETQQARLGDLANQTTTPELIEAKQAWLDWYEAHGGVKQGRIFPRSQMTLIRIRRRVTAMAGVEWIQDGARNTFASAHYKTHQDALKTAYELGHRGTNMLHPLQPEHAQGRGGSILGRPADVIRKDGWSQN